MNQSLFQIALVIDDYDKAIDYYTTVLGFELIEDTVRSPIKRWVVVKPKGASGASLLLAKAKNEEQKLAIGNQSGGRVFLFMHTNDIGRDYQNLVKHEVEIIRGPIEEDFGKVIVFKDLYGNKWDLIQPKS
jgi:catechol 2,3-dioxygenase-like lactoylglutathione lyase family enzyme